MDKLEEDSRLRYVDLRQRIDQQEERLIRLEEKADRQDKRMDRMEQRLYTLDKNIDAFLRELLYVKDRGQRNGSHARVEALKMSHPFYGDVPPDVIAEFEADRAAAIAESNRRIASGKFGDIPDELTEEGERILDQVWRELAAEEAAEKRTRNRKKRVTVGKHDGLLSENLGKNGLFRQ